MVRIIDSKAVTMFSSQDNSSIPILTFSRVVEFGQDY